ATQPSSPAIQSITPVVGEWPIARPLVPALLRTRLWTSLHLKQRDTDLPSPCDEEPAPTPRPSTRTGNCPYPAAGRDPSRSRSPILRAPTARQASPRRRADLPSVHHFRHRRRSLGLEYSGRG